jgi:hypothetical protein
MPPWISWGWMTPMPSSWSSTNREPGCSGECEEKPGSALAFSPPVRAPSAGDLGARVRTNAVMVEVGAERGGAVPRPLPWPSHRQPRLIPL